MELTDEQAQAVELFKTSESLKISAFAGTGKTSTLTALSRSTHRRGLYLAFNKSIAEEARTKFPDTVDCRTTHSLALRAVPNAFRSNKDKLFGPLQGNRVAQLLAIEELCVSGVTLKPRSLGYLTAKTVQRFCQSGDAEVLGRHVPLSGKLEHLAPEHKDEFRSYLAKLAAHLWDRMSNPSDHATLGHDGYLKLWSLSQPQLDYDFLLLDEAQDTNEAVLSVLRRQQSHLTLVGDRHQQIYEWRGATNAMASIDTDAEAVLTRSFRFGDEIASAASSILRVLGETRPVIGAPNRRSRIRTDGATRAVLCRTNAGVVAAVVDALSLGRRPHVVGGVVDLIQMLEDVSRLKRGIPSERAEFFGFKDWEEVVAFAGSDEGESLRSFVAIVDTYGEVALIQRLKSVESEESAAELIVSTGHKAKGREWDSVTLHSDFEPRPSKDDPKKFVLNPEEARLLYVATTRAKELLVVPPRLAAKWDASVAPATPPVKASPPAPPPQRKTPPELPAFVKVVKPQPTAPALAKKAAPKTVPAPACSEAPAPVQAKPEAVPSQTALHVQSTKAASTGVVASLVKFFFG